MECKIDSNMRNIKYLVENSERHPRPIYVINGEADIDMENQLCHHCAKLENLTCDTMLQICDMNTKLGMTVKVTACPNYMPVVGFREPVMGLDGEFTTFRAGKAWAARLPDERVVGLYDENKKELIGRAVVKRTETGKLSEMLELYAHLNHSQKGLPPEGASERVGGRLKKLYGPRVANMDKLFTVIFMERLS